MSQTPPDLLGRLAVHYKLISMDQLVTATQEQSRSPSKRLGAILVELGYIDQNELAQLLEAQRQYLAQQAQQTPKPHPPAEREVVHNPARVQWLNRVLQRAVSMNSSDVHIHAGAQLKARIYGTLVDLMPELLSSQECESVLVSAMDAKQREQYFE